MADTSIEWTDKAWNVLRGCTRVSPGCVHCYAERQAARFSGPGQPYEGLVRISPKADGRREPRWTGAIRFVSEKLAEPLSWRKPCRVFMDAKGRRASVAGTANPRAKLSPEDVAEIRRLRGDSSQRALARRYGVSKTQIGNIQRGEAWAREWPVPR